MYLCRSSRAHALLAISACILTLVLVGSTVAALDTDARPGEARQLWQWQDAGQTRLAGSPQAYVQAVDDDDGGDDDDDDDDDDDEKKKKGPFTAAYKKHVEDLLEEWRVPGVAIGVVDGEDVWTAGYGIATFPATPVTPQTIFYGASTSKAFTSSVLALMITSGNYSVPAGPPAARLAWDTPIASLIPDDFVLAADGTGNGNGNGEGGTAAWATAHLTLEDALSHRTGMPRHDKASPHFLLSPSSGAPGGHTNDTRTPATVRDITRLQRHLPLNAAPRTKWQYCNHMYVVATHVVETLTGGRSLGAVLREWIWEPLGMQGTYFSLEDALAAAARERREEEGHYVASGYSWDPRTQTFTTVELMPTDEVGGAGAVMSTVDDYTKWLRMWLRQGAPLSAEAQRAVLTPRMLVNPEGTVVAAEDTGEGAASQQPYDFPLAYALGWQVGSYRGHRFWTHSGGMHAYGAEVFFCPQLEFGFVAFGNTALTSNALELALMWDMVDDRLGVPLDQRRDWTTGFQHYYEKAEAGMNQSIAKYYPDRPASPLPMALPVEAYSGTYFHPGYLNFTVQLAGDMDKKHILRDNITLAAIRADATWPSMNLFEHVSGEYWMMYQYYLGSPQGPTQEYAPAQFEIGPDGRVARMGITWLAVSPGKEDTVEGLVWFDKID